MHRLISLSALALVAVAGCEQRKSVTHTAQAAMPAQPDEWPALVTAELPFRYPAALNARKVQCKVTLRLFIDRDGRVQSDSTRVDEPSGVPALDSAALAGAKELAFVPAKLHGEPVGVHILFPVYFRHPEAPPLSGDSALHAPERGPGDA
jgi:TonB family protein